jgi:hypothetical protein
VGVDFDEVRRAQRRHDAGLTVPERAAATLLVSVAGT